MGEEALVAWGHWGCRGCQSVDMLSYLGYLMAQRLQVSHRGLKLPVMRIQQAASCQLFAARYCTQLSVASWWLLLLGPRPSHTCNVYPKP